MIASILFVFMEFVMEFPFNKNNFDLNKEWQSLISFDVVTISYQPSFLEHIFL